MTAAHNPLSLYIVAWDWLLNGLYVLIAVAACLGIVAALRVEYDNRGPK